MKNSRGILLCGAVLITSILALPVRQSLLAKTEETTTAVVVESSVTPSSEAPIEETSSLPSSETRPSVSSSQKEVVSSQSTQESNIESSTEAAAISESSRSVSYIEEKVEETTASSEVIPQTAAAPISVIQPPATKQEVEENFQFSVIKNQTTQEFIDSIGKDAQRIAWDEGLYASVMIAQAILETGSGNSQLARPPYHNLFGIKGSYQGKQVNFATQEDNGSGQLYTIQSGFRQYPSYKESLEDYAALLKKGISGNAGFYQGVWKEYAKTYQVATKALTGKYATDTQYDKKLNALIDTYRLTDYDKDPAITEEKDRTTKESAKKDKKTKTEEKTEETHTEGVEKDEALTAESLQQVIELLPIPQRPAKQVPGYLRTQ